MQIIPRSLSERLLAEYHASLAAKAPGILDVWLRVVWQLLDWIAARPGQALYFGSYNAQRVLKNSCPH